jgi:hypothetical protein
MVFVDREARVEAKEGDWPLVRGTLKEVARPLIGAVRLLKRDGINFR